MKLILFGKIPLQFSAIYEVVELLFKPSQENCVANAKRISLHLEKKKKLLLHSFPMLSRPPGNISEVVVPDISRVKKCNVQLCSGLF